ncbi:hypothetical protein [Pannonibacter sp. SL95]|jgi:hypothetical protein|uniref:hypothetical protein n=1 Tax=Pannonibacter sp. SL95 TaxID=2995153 RepID=UPI00227372B9|nr:hypothetical protein [Pannonibacter sp. SL95]MCY1708026.1 hypothetical protein [Pannonibacter sp. SL95]
MNRVAPESLNEDHCPVSEETFQALMRQNAASAASVADTLPEDQRARLAVFCYRKAHLRPLGFAIAAGCSRRALVEEAGHAGELLFQQSRAASGNAGVEPYLAARTQRRPVTLCSIKG